MPAYPSVYSSFSLGPLALKNRIVMAPMGTNTADENGFVTQQALDYYETRAQGGVGLVIVEICCVKAPEGQSGLRRFAVDNDKYVSGLARLAKSIHRNGAKAAIQLQHSGKESIVRSVTGQAPVAPSAVPAADGGMARELTVGEIQEIIRCFADGAKRAKQAGFDAIEVHGASAYLVAQFISSYWNKRQDDYGGAVQKRARFLVEILQAIRQVVGPAYPFWPRLNAQEFGSLAGLTQEEGRVVAQIAEQAGAYAIHCTSRGNMYHLPPMGIPQGNMIPLAAGIKQAVKVPVIVVGRMDPSLGERVILKGEADLISIGRALLADPELPNKYAEGHPDDVKPCIACAHCSDFIRSPASVKCVVNPPLAQERAFVIRPTTKVKRVLVVGGGPAGMEAARVAALRGHRVSLYEKEPRLGGLLNLASLPPYKGTIVSLTQYLVTQVKKLDVEVHLGTKMSPELLRCTRSDCVILAAGAESFIPPMHIRSNNKVVLAVNILSGKSLVGKTVVIVGGELVGCETAEVLADQGKKVTVVRRGLEMATKVRTNTRFLLLERLKAKGVTLLKGISSYEEINSEGLVFIKDGRSNVLSADSVVIAAGARPDTKFIEAVKKDFPNAHVVGDLVQPRGILEAIHEGYLAGFSV